jgi:hypothetical protein
VAEVVFRDGPREIPDHLADLMAGLETFRMTFDEAVNAANRRLVSDRLERARRELIRDHFKEHPT